MARSHPGDGAYTITLAAGDEYGFLAQLAGFYPTSQNIDGRELGQYTEVERDLYLTPLEVGASIRLNNLFFDTGKYALRATSYSELNRLVKIMQINSRMVIEITGHTDNVGSEENNQQLSENRAGAVLNYLVSKGIGKERLSKRGFGESQFIGENTTEAGRQLNRRVEFVIKAVR